MAHFIFHLPLFFFFIRFVSSFFIFISMRGRVSHECVCICWLNEHKSMQWHWRLETTEWTNKIKWYEFPRTNGTCANKQFDAVSMQLPLVRRLPCQNCVRIIIIISVILHQHLHRSDLSLHGKCLGERRREGEEMRGKFLVGIILITHSMWLLFARALVCECVHKFKWIAELNIFNLNCLAS